MVGKFKVDTTAYVQRHRREPCGVHKWTFVVVGRHAQYGSCAKVTDVTEPISFEAMLDQARHVGETSCIPGGTIRVMP